VCPRPVPSQSAERTREPSWLEPDIAPSEILREEFLKPFAVGQAAAAKKLGVPQADERFASRVPKTLSLDSAGPKAGVILVHPFGMPTWP
jgi:hypothetical protein